MTKEKAPFIRKTDMVEIRANTDAGVAVLYGAVGIEEEAPKRDALIGRQIIDDLLSGRRKRVITFGPAGIGKTIFLSQLEQQISELSKGQVRFSSVRYDAVSAECENRLGRLKKDWEKADWAFLNDRLVERAQVPAATTERNLSVITSLEINGTGKKGDRDRGVTALKKIVEQERQSGKEGQTLYLGFTPDTRIQNLAGQNRKDVLITPDDQVVNLLESRNILVLGSAVTGKPGIVVGGLLKALFRSMADTTQINIINEENLELEGTLPFTQVERAELTQKLFPASKFWRHTLPREQKPLTLIKRLAYFTYGYAKKELQIPKENRYLLINPLRKRGWIYWFVNNP